MSTDKAFEPKPNQRLITINLLVSAADFESNEAMDLVALENLCHTIDVFCLYDQAVVLRRGDAIRPDRESDLFDALEDAKFLSFIQSSPQQVNAICRVASTHLAPALGISDPDTYIKLFQSAWGAEDYFIDMKSDSTPRTEEDWKTQLRQERDILSRTNAFIARTFLYLACASQLGYVLTPDVQRHPILAHAADQEEFFRGRILQVLRQKYKDFFDGYGDPKLRGKVSPCAAIVFQEAKGKKSSIPWEMTRLRGKLTSTRDSLRTLEQEISSNQDDPYKQLQAFDKWNKMVDDLARNYLKPSFRNLSTERKILSILNLSSTPMKDLVGLAAQPHDPTKWAQTISDLPLDKLVLSLKLRPLIDLYTVLQPSSLLSLGPLVVSLFGEQVLY